jgi:hypothetical protein
VTIADAHGNAIVGATVLFRASAGTVSVPSAKTDAKGRASTMWTLGPKAEQQTLTASVAGTSVKAAVEVVVTAPSKLRQPAKAPAKPPVKPTTKKK